MQRPASGMQGDDFGSVLLTRMSETVEKLDHMLAGNGGPGLLTKQALLEADVKRLWRALDKLDRKDKSNVALVEKAIRKTMPNPDAQLKLAEAKWLFWAKVAGMGAVPSVLAEILSKLFT